MGIPAQRRRSRLGRGHQRRFRHGHRRRDVNNGIARRSWARNKGAMFAIQREMERTPELKVTIPYLVDDKLL